MIKNSTFGFQQESELISKEIVKPILEEILPKWEITYRDLLLKKSKVLYERV